MTKRHILIPIILLQLGIVFLLGRSLYIKKQVLGTTSVNPIPQSTIVSENIDGLAYFYEPKPDAILKPEVIFEGLEKVSYHTNKEGFNQLADYPIEKEPNTYRIVTLGDSHTFGQNVNTQDNYPSQLTQLLNTKLSCPSIHKFEVINLGVAGYDFQYEVERYKLKGQKYNPDLIIWMVVSDDLLRVNEQLRPKLQAYTRQAKKTGEYEKDVKNGDYYAIWAKARDNVVESLGGKEKVYEIQKNNINQITQYFSGPIIITTYENTLTQPENTFLDTFSKDRNNTLFYPHLPNIYTMPEALLPDNHPNKKGHALIATTLLHYLIDSNILPCSLK